MQRDILKVSLCLFTLFLFEAGAVPWREKNTLRVASALPKRLIDSIMAQGNWNILFQQGPFSEFQRQMAIGDHFALRGEVSQAELYFRRAETALEIAYASLRSRFEWPRSPAQLRADELPWGENRDTFRDYLLCRLQLYLESGLAAHDTGKIRLDRLQETVARTEYQMGQSLKDRDADLENFVQLLRASTGLRTAGNMSRSLRAARFFELSAAIEPSARNYWRRRTIFFQIREHLYYGNLGIARALTDFLHASHGEQSDPLALARFWIQSSDFAAAGRLLESEFRRSEVQSGENYQDFLRISETLQNLLIWQRQYLRAAEIAETSHNVLNRFIAESQVPREEFVPVRRSAANQKLRSEMLRFLASSQCPASLQPFEGSEPETEWRIRERLFYERCGLPAARNTLQAWLREKSLSSEAREIIRYALGMPAPPKQPADATTLVQYLALYRALQGSGSKPRRTELAIALLDRAGRLHDDLVFLDWGLTLPSDSRERALRELGSLRPKEAVAVFTAMHRQLARRQLRGSSLLPFSAGDAGELGNEIHDWVLGGDRGAQPIPAAEPGGDLLYADSTQTILYQPGIQNSTLQVYGKWNSIDAGQRARFFRPGNPVRLFGLAPVLAGAPPDETTVLQIAPLFNSCTDCSPAARTPARLLLHDLKANDWDATRADLSDLFSTQINLRAKPECFFSAGVFQDTLITPATDIPAEYPCNIALENLIVEAEKSAQNTGHLGLLWAVAGRQSGAAIMLPGNIDPKARTAFLFDFLQRRNRREVSARQAFAEARRRAEKSFPPGSGIEAVQIYAALD